MFKALDDEFRFTLDAAAADDNHLCPRYYTRETDGLAQDWSGETVFCNPPYGRSEIKAWTRKCLEEGAKPNTTVVALIPSRTGAGWFQDNVLGKAEVRFIRGRLHFGGPSDINAPFDSVIAIWRKKED